MTTKEENPREKQNAEQKQRKGTKAQYEKEQQKAPKPRTETKHKLRTNATLHYIYIRTTRTPRSGYERAQSARRLRGEPSDKKQLNSTREQNKAKRPPQRKRRRSNDGARNSTSRLDQPSQAAGPGHDHTRGERTHRTQRREREPAVGTRPTTQDGQKPSKSKNVLYNVETGQTPRQRSQGRSDVNENASNTQTPAKTPAD